MEPRGDVRAGRTSAARRALTDPRPSAATRSVREPAPVPKLRERSAGLLGAVLLLVMGLVIASDWGAPPALGQVTALAVVALTVLLAVAVPPSRLVFIVAAAILTAICIAVREDWVAEVTRGLNVSAFIAAFFSALATLRNAAQSSPAIQTCGRFLASQPPGRRYAALSVGGQLFSLLLNYGAIALLGSLAVASAREEPDEQIRAIRMRRMLLAVHRSLVATLPWSPLSFAVAISTTLIPGTAWSSIVVPGLVSGALLAGIGYAMDTLFKPRLNRAAPPRPQQQGGWGNLRPLLVLLAVLFTLVGSLHVLTGVSTVGVVILVVPAVSAVWIAAQADPGRRRAHLLSRVRDYMVRELPGYRGEITLLAMAGYIGTIGSALLDPVIVDAGFDLSRVPTVALLVGLVWIFPLAGQAAMNPILAASLIIPLLPAPQDLGISPTALQAALVAGWSLTGVCSPFTASTLITGSLAGKSAWHVGLRWNGLYTLICGAALSVWVVLYAYVA